MMRPFDARQAKRDVTAMSDVSLKLLRLASSVEKVDDRLGQSVFYLIERFAWSHLIATVALLYASCYTPLRFEEIHDVTTSNTQLCSSNETITIYLDFGALL
jgi:hypothetical protein